MESAVSVVVPALLIGIFATAFLDLCAVAFKVVFGVPAPDYALVGRWLGHMPHGVFAHSAIAKAEPVRGEAFIGWTAHYIIGVGYAALFLVLAGQGWTARPTALPALAFGVVTVIAPFFIMQPGMGAGFAASRAPNPMAARLRSLIAHTLFGAGLYLGAELLLAISVFTKA